MVEIETTNYFAIKCLGIGKYFFVIAFVSPLLADSIHHVRDDVQRGIDQIYFELFLSIKLLNK